MSLKGLKKQITPENISAEDFIQGASTHSIAEPKTSNAKFIRQTFSLTQEVSDQIDELLVKSKVARANRSVIVKAAIQKLISLSEDELHVLVLKAKK